MFVPISDPRLNFYAPQPVSRDLPEVRLERFPRACIELLYGRMGPLANLRSASGCALLFATDSPWVDLHLERLRHHQVVPCGVAAEIRHDDSWLVSDSVDLREREGTVRVRLATGSERGGPLRETWLWQPLISTAAIAGITLADGAQIAAVTPPAPRWLAIGDSLTQGFSVQSPVQTWVHRLWRAWELPAWNLGVGGLMIEPEIFRWALEQQRWPLVTIALGSNHSWSDADAAIAGARATQMAELVVSGGHQRVLWCLPPWKPCEDGKGPPEFAGVPLDRATGARVARVRADIRAALSAFPSISILEDPLPHDQRWYPDGLHPFAPGFARYADAVARVLDPPSS